MADGGGKRVSWVELYLDLIFVLAVGQLSHLIVGEPEMHSVWVALGLFFTLWWTWIGFSVLYNRFGADTPSQRLLFLACSVPTGVAAVAIEPASTGDVTVFALSLAITRLFLAYANGQAGGWRDILRGRIAVAYLISAGLFLLSIWVPEPFRYALWALGITQESGAMLHDDRQAARRAREEHDFSLFKPENPEDALDPHHFAERFGLFLIILLGEVVVEAGQASVDGHVASFDGWMALVAAMILAGALWWLYFDSAADLNLRILELSGGSPTMAKALYAVGHMVPSFALLLIASGVGLLLEEDAPRIGYALPALGVGIYLLGTRVFLAAKSHRARVCVWSWSSPSSRSAASTRRSRRTRICGCWPASRWCAPRSRCGECPTRTWRRCARLGSLDQQERVPVRITEQEHRRVAGERRAAPRGDVVAEDLADVHAGLRELGAVARDVGGHEDHARLDARGVARHQRQRGLRAGRDDLDPSLAGVVGEVEPVLEPEHAGVEGDRLVLVADGDDHGRGLSDVRHIRFDDGRHGN